MNLIVLIVCSIFRRIWFAEISICVNHSHTLDTADALGNLRSISDTRQLFETYFNDGLG